MSSRLAALPMPVTAASAGARAMLHRILWPAGLGLLFVVITVLTWQRWTDPAFPIDIGREMQVPRMIVHGKLLYRDIGCFYGPVGYWINAGFVAVFGEQQSVLWYANLARFSATIVLLWIIARRVLGPAIAALALASYVYAYFFSLMVPYSAGHGWGTLLLVAGVACMGRQFSFLPGRNTRNAGSTREDKAIGSSIAAALLFSLALAAKHEIALCALVILVILIVDLVWRYPAGQTRRLAILLTLIAAVLPVALVAVVVLHSVPLEVVIRENIWMPEMWEHFGGVSTYAFATALDTWKLILLVEWVGLLAAAMALVGLLAPADRRPPARVLWGLLLAGAILAAAAEGYQLCSGVTGRDVVNYPKPRLRELVETLSLLCLPLSLLVMLALGRIGRHRLRNGRPLRQTWLRLGPRHQLGIVCLVGYLSFVPRDIPTGLGLVRGPFAPVVLAWLLTRVLPRLAAWRHGVRRAWVAAVGLALAAGTACAIDNLVFLQTRPSTFVHGELGSMYAWQRREPYVPAWFQDAIDIVARNRTRIGDDSIVCAPEGGWVHALLGLDWPTRDIPWSNFCGRRLIEDFERRPPRFVLVMEPNLMATDYPHILELVLREYVPIDTNTSGMTLYERPAGSAGMEPILKPPGDTGASPVRHLSQKGVKS